jgi:carbamoyl-phosphate synthase large subunit
MTDPIVADRTYIEPITAEIVEKIIEKERPDVILPTVGGQTALNCALDLAKKGILKKHNIELIGASIDAIKKAEDRYLFQKAMDKIGLETPRNAIVHNMEEAMIALQTIGLPAIIRPSFTMGGAGGGVAYNKAEYKQIVESGLATSPTTEVLIDESIIGWKEYEMEVVRDKNDNAIIICSIENIDPMGVHTGDSITVAPALTLTDKEYQNMRNASIAVLREIGVETGGSNVQFAVNPKNGKLLVIEMNPRVSRSSALASKATGFPIAKVAAKLAIGYTLDEIRNDITDGKTPASFEPTIDYIVTKIPKFTFEKFKGSKNILSSSMKSVGEAMAIGRSFAESLQKALRSMESKLTGLDDVIIHSENKTERIKILKARLEIADPIRLLLIAQSFREGLSIKEINQITNYEPWFLEQIKNLVAIEEEVKINGLPGDRKGLLFLKKMGFSDKRLANLVKSDETKIRQLRHKLNVRPVYKRVDSCAGEFDSTTSYMYSCYET